MLQTANRIVAHNAIGRTDAVPSLQKALKISRSHRDAEEYILRKVSLIVASLAIFPLARQEFLLEQYRYKLRSHGNRLGRFCLSVVPAIACMALVFLAFKVLCRLRPRD